MKNNNFIELHAKVTDIGKHFTFNDIEYEFIHCIAYSWHTPSYNGWDHIVTTPHPLRKELGIVLGFYKTVIEKIEDIEINLHVIGYYSRGPSGPYAQVIGKIGDKEIHVTAFYNGTAARYDPIHDIKIGNHFFHTYYGLHSFYLTVFKKRA
jgi:hypothetical protein